MKEMTVKGRFFAVLVPCLILAGAALAAVSHQLSRGDWVRLIAPHKGHPTIVHFWAETCGPCLAELKQWGKLHREHPDIHLVLVQSDPLPETDEASSSQLLRDAGLDKVESWTLADLFDEKMRAEVHPDWNGELPMTVMLDRRQKASMLTGESDFSPVLAWIKRTN